MRIPDYCTPLVGYRVWRVMKGGLLTGVHVCEPWAPKQAHKANCQRKYGSNFNGASYSDSETSPHLVDGVFQPTPVFSCLCGLWAKRTDADLFQAASADEAPHYEGYAWGTVSIWGRVIEHDNGWRAEFAYPKELKATSDAEQVSALYGIPCEAVALKPREEKLDGWWESGWHKMPLTIPRYYNYIPLSPPTMPIVTAPQTATEIERLRESLRQQNEARREYLSRKNTGYQMLNGGW